MTKEEAAIRTSKGIWNNISEYIRERIVDKCDEGGFETRVYINNLSDDDKKFYSKELKFSKKDFEDKKIEDNIEFEFNTDKINNNKNNITNNLENNVINAKEDEEDFYDDDFNDGNGKFFFKVLLLIFGLALVVVVAIYLLNYFNRI